MLQCCTAGSCRRSLTGCSLPEDEPFGWQDALQVMWCMYSGCKPGAPQLCCFIEHRPWSRGPGGLGLHSSCIPRGIEEGRTRAPFPLLSKVPELSPGTLRIFTGKVEVACGVDI